MNVVKTLMNRLFRFSTEDVSPSRLLLLVTASVIVSDAIIHLLFLTTFNVAHILYSFVNSIVTIGLVFPFLYLFFYRPIVSQMHKRELAERTLRESQLHYHAIVQDQTDGICQWLPDGKVVFSNLALRRIFQKDEQELSRLPYWELFTAQQIDIKTQLSRLSPTSPVIQFTDCLTLPDFQVRWLHWTVRALYNEQDQLQFYLAAAHDFTEQNDTMQALQEAYNELEKRVKERTAELAQANESLVEREARLQLQSAALEAAASGIIITNREGVIEWANPAFYAMTGYAPAELLNNTTSILKSGQHSDDFYQDLWKTVLAGKVWNGEIINRRKDGTTYVEEQTITPVRDSQDRIRHFIAIKRDITQRIEAQEKVRRRNQELSILNSMSSQVNSTLEANEIFDILVHLLAHELSIPAGAIFYSAQESPDFILRASWGISSETSHLLIKDYSVSKNGQTGKSVTTLLPDQEPWAVCLRLPFYFQSREQGAVFLLSESANRFSPEDVQFFEALNAQVAIALQNAHLLQEIRAGRARLRALSRRLVEIQEQERRHVARELHDEAAQALTYLVFAIEMLKKDARSPKAVLSGLKDLEKAVQDVLNDLHRLAVDLRPASLDLLGLIPALNQYTGFLREKHGLEVKLVTAGMERLPNTVETALYRIIQESLVNIVRHAQASSVEILLYKSEVNQITVSIVDNGIGFDTEKLAQSERLGIFGMRERAEMLGGKLSVSSLVGGGTKVLVEVPGDHQSIDS